MNSRVTQAEIEAMGLDPQTATLRIPPHSSESESAVLGALLLDNAAWDRLGDLLTEADFYSFENRAVFGAIAQLILASRPADVFTVFDHLERQGKDAEVGGLAYINSLAQALPSSANARRYAEIVRERAILRRLITSADTIASEAFNPGTRSVATLIDEAQRRILAITESEAAARDDWVSMSSLVGEQLDKLQAAMDEDETRPASFIPTGLAALDEFMDGGMRAGQLIVIGARPGMGKSAIADTIGLHVARNGGLPVGKFSMEMQNAEGGQRALSAETRIPLHTLRRPQRMSDRHWSDLTEGVETLRNVPFYSNDQGGLNINQLRSKARQLRRKHGLSLLLVDYLQLMSGTDPKAPRTYQLEEASRGLKSLAKELGIPVIALAQVNRGVEKEVDQMPRMSDLKDCGAIEQDADVILFLHRPIVAKPDLGPEWKHYAKANLAKQRGGRTGYFDLQYVGENTKFSDWPDGYAAPSIPVRTRGREL